MTAKRKPKHRAKRKCAECEDLKRWKAEAISVMPDYQQIGRLLGMRIGESVHDKIIPGIIAIRDLHRAATDRNVKLITDLQALMAKQTPNLRGERLVPASLIAEIIQ